MRRKSKKKKSIIRKNVLTIAIMGFLVIIGVWFTMMYTHLQVINKGYEQDIEELENKLDSKKRNLTLEKAQVNYYQTDEYVEKIAREKLGLVRPNEIVYIQTD